MNFRSLFKRFAGERPREDGSSAQAATSVDMPASTAYTAEQGTPEPARKQKPTEPPAVPDAPGVDQKRQGQKQKCSKVTLPKLNMEMKLPRKPPMAFIPPLDFGDEWRGRPCAFAVDIVEQYGNGLGWLYSYYPRRLSTGRCSIRHERLTTILRLESELAKERRDGGKHRLRAMFLAFLAKDTNPLAAEYMRSADKLTGELAVCCVNSLAPAISDGRIKGFIAQYIDMDSVNAVADKCEDINRTILNAILDKNYGALHELASLGMVPRLGSFGTSIAVHTDFNCMYMNEYRAPLASAVERNDIAEAHCLISCGADVNQLMVMSSGREDNAWRYWFSPVLMNVRSVGMYKLFVEAKAQLHPWSQKCRGEETVAVEECNLLKQLWYGPAMDDAAIELADYLVATEYDMALRSEIEEIRSLTNRDDGGPYRNNRAYVLEWCDMEKRAIAAFSKYVDSLHEYSPYSLGHDLSIFLEDWKTRGYDYACENSEVGTDEIPPRYVYPERIIKRGVQNGVS